MGRLIVILVVLFGALHWYSNRGMAAGDPRKQTGTDGLVMLSAEWCGYCNALRAELNRMNVPYRELDIERDREGELAFDALDARGVPVLVVGQDVIYGYDPAGARQLIAAAGHSISTP